MFSVDKMDRYEIIARLNEITSFFSFGRILGYISFFETVGIERQLKHGQESNRDRLLSTEIDFLCGLWLQNVNLAKNWDIIKDEEIRKEVYGLMDDLHNLYRDSQDFGDLYSEVTKIVYFIGNEHMLIAHDSNRLRFS